MVRREIGVVVCLIYARYYLLKLKPSYLKTHLLRNTIPMADERFKAAAGDEKIRKKPKQTERETKLGKNKKKEKRKSKGEENMEQ